MYTTVSYFASRHAKASPAKRALPGERKEVVSKCTRCSSQSFWARLAGRVVKEVGFVVAADERVGLSSLPQQGRKGLELEREVVKGRKGLELEREVVKGRKELELEREVVEGRKAMELTR